MDAVKRLIVDAMVVEISFYFRFEDCDSVIP